MTFLLSPLQGFGSEQTCLPQASHHSPRVLGGLEMKNRIPHCGTSSPTSSRKARLCRSKAEGNLMLILNFIRLVVKKYIVTGILFIIIQ